MEIPKNLACRILGRLGTKNALVVTWPNSRLAGQVTLGSTVANRPMRSLNPHTERITSEKSVFYEQVTGVLWACIEVALWCGDKLPDVLDYSGCLSA
jgi:hypothetical protein